MRLDSVSRLAHLDPRRLKGAALAVVAAAAFSPEPRAEAPFAPPPNDFCNAPVTLTLDIPVSGTTAEAKNDYQLSGGACFTGIGQTASAAAGRDVVYRFKATAAGSYSFRVKGYATAADLVLYVAGSCPTTGTPPIVVTTCQGAANRGSSTTAEEVACLALAAGQEVFAFVDEHTASSGGSGFTIEVNRCVRESEPNDTPPTAGGRACPTEGSISPAGDVDFFRLGVPASGSRVFALADGVAANSGDFDLRVTTSVDTREYDDADNDAPYGSLAPNVAGTPLTGIEAFLRVNHRTAPAIAAEPYRLYGVVQPPFTMSTAEIEPNDTTAQANAAANRYFRGTIGTSADVDHFKVDANAGDIVVLGLDADPQRNNTPGDLALALLDSSGVLVSVNDADALSDVTPGAGSLTSTTPRSPGEAIAYRVATTGTYYARVSGAPGIDYLLSTAINCKIFPATDLALAMGASPQCVAAGQPLTYVATVSNPGTATARNVVFTDPLPSSVTLVSAVPSQGACTGGTTVRCHLGDILAGASATVTINVTANSAGPFTNTASVDSDVTDSNAANDSAAATTNGTCSDGSLCTNGDTCSGGTCVGGPPLDCADTNPCTDDSCSATVGCMHTNNAAPCSDGNPCTSGDACSSGACAGGPLTDCSDGNPCTDDACTPSTGCVHSNNVAPCEDGNPCSTGDRCSGGACVAGACHGTCPASGQECTQDAFERCVCVSGSTPCGGIAPNCGGDCPDGSLCRRHGTGTSCACEPLPPCGSATSPQCAGTCPSGLQCEPAGSTTLDCTCRPAEVPCEASGAPACGGVCEIGYKCTADGGRCACTPDQPSCGAALAPRCGGACSGRAYCRPATTGGTCVCSVLDVPCGEASAPACGGRCGDDERCVPRTGNTCVCAPATCGDAVFPECGGACPPGATCRSDTSQGTCACQPDTPVTCGSTPAPACGGICPPGQVCESDPSGSYCRCEPKPAPCGSTYPQCGGECPGDEVCTLGPGACVCAPPVFDCGQGVAPACNGNCPQGQRCEPSIIGEGCQCNAPDPPCGDAQAPWCNGDCPLATQCLPSASGGACSCQGCGFAAPAPDLTLLWSSRVRFEWSPSSCATTFNVYRRIGQRFADADHDGLADDYGSCLYPAVITEFAIDTAKPGPGWMFSYLVTGKNAVGEGSLGYTSSGLRRPNRAPCP